ncbi:MAG: ornithine carbamoyltransferase [Gemmatimonadetes bacterium]|nr:ornithine carbamoyltransferase [Gemmatimonadota bacterium]
MRHFLSFADLAPDEVVPLLDRAAALKRGARSDALAGKTVVLLFEKPSLRTKLSFWVGTQLLGGNPIYFSPEEVGLGRREPVPDVARVVSRMAAIAVIRTFGQERLEEFAAAASIPVVNALSDGEHPCQALADILTIREQKGGFKGVRTAYIGDGNNVAVSLALAIASVGGDLVIASPPGYELAPDVAARARRLARASGGSLALVHSPEEAVAGADIVYTDVWASMGQETETARRAAAFRGFQVNPALMARAKADARFMHDMPAHPGEEVSPGMLDEPCSVAFDQAENRLWAQTALLEKIAATL